MKSLGLASVIVSAFFAFSAAADELRIATVDVARILNELPEAVSKKKELDALSAEAKSKADAKRKALQATEAKLKSQKVSPDSKEADAFRNDAKDYARFVKDTEEEIRSKFTKANKDITDKAMTKVNDYAKRNQIDLVIDKSQSYRGPVLYGKESADITSEILKEMAG